MKEIYRLHIRSKATIDKYQIDSVLGMEATKFSNSAGTSWVYEVEYNEALGWFVDYFYEKLKDKHKHLREIGVKNGEISIWWLLEYNQQCNFELSEEDMKKMVEVEATLCVSCWQK